MVPVTYISAVRILELVQAFIGTSLLEEQINGVHMVRGADVYRPGCSVISRDGGMWVKSSLFGRGSVKTAKRI